MYKYFAILLFLFVIIYPQSLSAQSKNPTEDSIIESSRLAWLSTGLGFMGNGVAANARLIYSWGTKSISGRASFSAPFSPGGGSGGESIGEFGLYYGAQAFSTGTLGRAAVGLSYLFGDKDYGKLIRTIGIGLEAEAMLKSNPFGIGLMLLILISPQYTSFGITLNIHLGKLY
jgi:hypothetical protein